MRKEYNFSNSIKNPYSKKLKKQITIRINDETIKYFKELSEEVGMPYQNLMNLYLNDCAEHNKKIKVNWQ
jgi:predicted DNA binding CopG/RHH family protein